MLADGGQVNKKLYKTLRNEENYFYYFRLHPSFVGITAERE